MADDRIPFNRPYTVGTELDYVLEALELGQFSGNGELTRRCSAWLEDRCGSERALLTHSCTAALEMGALLAEVGPGDEVAMPSFTFPSTANAFVLRGATPVFVDIREDTLKYTWLDVGSSAGRRWGRPAGDLSRTEDLAARMIRLPLWVGLPDADVDRVVDAISRELEP